jgi:hypothetical protein
MAGRWASDCFDGFVGGVKPFASDGRPAYAPEKQGRDIAQQAVIRKPFSTAEI